MYRPPNYSPSQVDHKESQPTLLSPAPREDAALEPEVLIHFIFQPKNEDEITLVDQLKKEIERKTEEVDVDPEFIMYVSWEESEVDGLEQDWKSLARRAIMDKDPFSTCCVVFVDRQSLQDQRVMMVQTNPESGSPEVVGRCPAAEASLNAVAVDVGSADLDEALSQGQGSEVIWKSY